MLNSGDKKEDRAKRIAYLKAWSAGSVEQFDTNDRGVAEWYEKNAEMIDRKIENLGRENVKDKVMALLASTGSSEAAWAAVKAAVSMMGANEREAFLKGV